ncbi:MAG: DoxX family protein [Acidimicrobiia bacterium]|nr:DoxX family protein [Acidimicrobiia bacterium]
MALAGLLIVAGVLHFVVPRFYEQIVPRWAGNARFHVMWSGAAEVVSGLLLLVPPTRRAGAWLALVTLVLVYPANVQMAIDTGRPKDLMGVAVWLRLPLQLPMWRAAWRHTR